MTSEKSGDATDMSRLGANLVRVEELSQRLVSALSKGGKVRPSLQGPGRDLFARAAAASMADMLSDPGKMIEHQTRYWGRALKHYVEAQSRLAKGQMTPPEDATGRDRRFRDPRWQEHPYFNYLKQQYLIAAEAIAEAAGDLQGLPEKDRRRLSYFAGQIVDMFSPANFLGTNPEALARAVETEGQSLVDGLENLVRDLEANDGELLVTLADRDAFEVGGNLATMPGEVVFRNRLFELIQYAPTTGEVREVPILIFPPWINKFYILDLTERNSLIRWMAAQGFTVLVVSWKNPGPDYADVSLDDYVAEGFLAAIEQARDATGAPEVNVAGYCIAGTTLALTLALMKRRGLGGVRSATFLTTLTDFSDQGEVGVFLDDDFLDGIEAETREAGVLSALFMSRTFSFLRSNDLIYGPAIRSYMMGERPPAFDLLYWNGDATNLPGRMAMQYLRELCQANRFAEGGIAVCGETLRLSDVDLPLVAIACETDHIAAWGQSYAGIRKMGATDRTFVLSESGHIAGIVNPPSKGKYGHYVNGDWSGDANTWRAAAERREGSWWPLWSEWLDLRSGALVPARTPGGGRATLGPAPGTYVTEAPDPGRNA